MAQSVFGRGFAIFALLLVLVLWANSIYTIWTSTYPLDDGGTIHQIMYGTASKCIWTIAASVMFGFSSFLLLLKATETSHSE